MTNESQDDQDAKAEKARLRALRAKQRRERRNAKRRDKRASPAHRAAVAERKRLREEVKAKLYEGRVLHMLELIDNGGGTPLTAVELRRLHLVGYLDVARREATSPNPRLVVTVTGDETHVARWQPTALAGGAA